MTTTAWRYFPDASELMRKESGSLEVVGNPPFKTKGEVVEEGTAKEKRRRKREAADGDEDEDEGRIVLIEEPLPLATR